jgi:hypothetical protein
VHNSSNIVFTNCQSAEYLKDYYYQYVDSARRFEKVIFTCSDITDLTSTDITIFEPDSRETDTIAYVESENEIDLTVDRLNIVTTPAYTTKFNSYPLYQVIEGVKSQLGYCYDYKGLIASNNTLEEALSHVVVDAYTKAETNTLLAGKANKNGSASETFTTNSLNLMREGASTTLYNYKDGNDREYVSFYDRTGGSLTYQFTANQGDNIATERQLNTKANSADVYSKTETYTKSEVENLIDEHVPELPDNVVTDANYVHTDNNFTTTLKNKLDGIASGAEVNVQANWNETNSSSDAYIQNKPTIPTVPTNVSSFTNDAGYLTSYTETDPTVPAWAKSASKPTYTASEVGALPDSTVIPSKVSDLTNDSGFITNQKITLTLNNSSGVYSFSNGSTALTSDEAIQIITDTSKDVEVVYNNNTYHLVHLSGGGDQFTIKYNHVSGNDVFTIEMGYWRADGSYDFDWTIKMTSAILPVLSLMPLGFGHFEQKSISGTTITASVTSNYAFILHLGAIVAVHFTQDVPAKAKLNIQNTGAKDIYHGANPIASGVITSGKVGTFMFFTNRYYLLSVI